MSYQFIHEETYGRKSGRKTASKKKQLFQKGKINISELVAEATRAPGATPHVLMPAPPTYLYGQDLDLWVQAILDKAENAKDRTGRKLRTDRQIISAGIASFPMRSEDYNLLSDEAPERQRIEVWLKKNIAWLIEQYEESLGPVLLHLDEEYVHIHYYVEPEVIDHEHGYELVPRHPGYRAKRNAADNGARAKEQNRIYKETMREFQDDYWKKVGLSSGLTKTGPKRRRLSRAGYKQESAAAISVWHAQEIAATIVDKSELYAERRMELVEQILREESELDYAYARMDGYREGFKKGVDKGLIKGSNEGYQSGFKRGIKQGVNMGVSKIAEKRDALLLAVSEKFDPIAADILNNELDRFLNELTPLTKDR